MGAWVYRTNTSLVLDPDWGKTTPSAGSVFKITVTPGDSKKQKWDFYILFPDFETEDDLLDENKEDYDAVEVGQHLCEIVLEQGDQYEMSEVLEEDSASFVASIPILCFNPLDEEEFFWLSPPQNCKH